jgi:hypothetical protein
LGAYSALTDSFYTAAGVSSSSRLGIRYGLPALLSDIPGGVAGGIGVIQTYNAYQNGDLFTASQAGGATLGGIFFAEVGAGIGGVLGFGVFDPITVPVGAVIGGVWGGLQGASIGGSIYNNGFRPLDQPNSPVAIFPY